MRISGTRGSPPPPDLKVALNYLGGYRNTMTLVLTGLDIEEKAAWAEQELLRHPRRPGPFAAVDVRLLRFDQPDAPTNEQATAHLRITVKDPDPRTVGRAFSGAVMELALGGYAGFHTTTPPTPESAYGVYWPALVPASVVEQNVVRPDGTRQVVPHSVPDPRHAGAAHGHPGHPLHPSRLAGLFLPTLAPSAPPASSVPDGPEPRRRHGAGAAGAGVRGPVRGQGRQRQRRGVGPGRGGVRVAAGVPDRRPAAGTLPEAAGLPVHRYELPNLSALNFVIAGLLGEGVAASARPDPQAKGLGEYLRSRHVHIPAGLAGRHPPGDRRAPGEAAR